MKLLKQITAYKIHIPLFMVDLGALLFLALNKEVLMFELVVISQLVLLILLLAVHRQSSRQLLISQNWSNKTLLLQMALLLGFCSPVFLMNMPWLESAGWQHPAEIMIGKASEVTTILGVSIGAITIVGCLLLRKRGA
jgi:hypothetical protein